MFLVKHKQELKEIRSCLKVSWRPFFERELMVRPYNEIILHGKESRLTLGKIANVGTTNSG